MSNPIVTTWTGAPQPTSTNWASGQSWPQWEAAHEARAEANMESDQPQASGPITTTWTSGGVAKSVSTSKSPGETVPDWIDRHFTAVRALMDSFPPDVPAGLLARLRNCLTAWLPDARPVYRLEVFHGASDWRFRARAMNGEPLFQSEGYTRRADAERACRRLVRARLELPTGFLVLLIALAGLASCRGADARPDGFHMNVGTGYGEQDGNVGARESSFGGTATWIEVGWDWDLGASSAEREAQAIAERAELEKLRQSHAADLQALEQFRPPNSQPALVAPPAPSQGPSAPDLPPTATPELDAPQGAAQEAVEPAAAEEPPSDLPAKLGILAGGALGLWLLWKLWRCLNPPNAPPRAKR